MCVQVVGEIDSVQTAGVTCKVGDASLVLANPITFHIPKCLPGAAPDSTRTRTCAVVCASLLALRPLHHCARVVNTIECRRKWTSLLYLGRGM